MPGVFGLGLIFEHLELREFGDNDVVAIFCQTEGLVKCRV